MLSHNSPYLTIPTLTLRLTHGNALPSVMGELASKLINELPLVASVFSKFISVASHPIIV